MGVIWLYELSYRTREKRKLLRDLEKGNNVERIEGRTLVEQLFLTEEDINGSFDVGIINNVINNKQYYLQQLFLLMITMCQASSCFTSLTGQLLINNCSFFHKHCHCIFLLRQCLSDFRVQNNNRQSKLNLYIHAIEIMHFPKGMKELEGPWESQTPCLFSLPNRSCLRGLIKHILCCMIWYHYHHFDSIGLNNGHLLFQLMLI